MKIRQHFWLNDRCIHCGSISWYKLEKIAKERGVALPDENDTRVCLEREDGLRDLAPEPARREYASEDWDTIGIRVQEIDRLRVEAMNQPTQPENPF